MQAFDASLVDELLHEQYNFVARPTFRLLLSGMLQEIVLNPERNTKSGAPTPGILEMHP
ncbi:MAG: hypothetical protein FJY85_25510 [Deltaproteobacteria bacterium]|nr:hypothetical protein [Deltaproteobacteria bacterium]